MRSVGLHSWQSGGKCSRRSGTGRARALRQPAPSSTSYRRQSGRAAGTSSKNNEMLAVLLLGQRFHAIAPCNGSTAVKA